MMSSITLFILIIGNAASFSYNEDLAHEVIGYGLASYCPPDAIQ
jgi:hypothetical protein